jgi:hypothetical protein
MTKLRTALYCGLLVEVYVFCGKSTIETFRKEELRKGVV